MAQRSSGFHDWPNAADFHLRGGSGTPLSAHDDFSDQGVGSKGSQVIRNDDGSTALHVACEAGAVIIVRQMLDDGAEMLAQDGDGATPLHIASKHGYPEVIKELLSRGSDPMALDHEGSTPVHLACKASCRQSVETLLDYIQGDLPIDKDLRTPLHSAIAYDGIGIVRHVLDHYLGHWGCSMASAWPVALEELLLREDKNGFNALHAASRKTSVEYAEELLLRAVAHGARQTEGARSSPTLKDLLLNSQDLQGRSPLHLAVESGSADTVRLLCEESVGSRLISAADSAGQTALHLACSNGDKTIVTYLLRFGAPIDAVDHNKDTPAIVATRHGHKEILRFLIDHGASMLPAEAASSPLHEAVALGKADIVEELLDMTVEDRDGVYVDLRRTVDQRSRFPAMLAAQRGDEFLFNLLLADETQLSIMDLDKRSILHYAAEGGNESVLLSIASKSWLLSHLNTMDCFGYTPLRLAAEFGRTEAIEILLECNPLPSAELAMSAAATDAIGLRLLGVSGGFVEACELAETMQNAARKGHLGTLRTLLSEYCPDKLDPDHTNAKGISALMLAAEAGQLEVVRLLVTEGSGIAIDRASKSRRTALSYAAEHGHREVVEFLTKYLEVNVDSTDNEQRTPVFFAAMNGHLDVVKRLVSSNRSRSLGDRNMFGALCAAAEAGHMEVVEFLLRKGGSPSHADPDQRLAVFERGLREGCVDLVRVLSKHTSDERARDGQPLLHLAWKHPDALQEILRNVDVDATCGRQDITALGLAVKHGYVDSALVLLEHGADVLHRDRKGRTPLHYAATVRNHKQNAPGRKTVLHGEMLDLLLRYLEPSKPADVVDGKGNTPLSDAVEGNAIYSVRVLLARGDSDIGRLTYCGHSPLWVAVERGRYEMVNLMLDMVPRPRLNSELGESYQELISVPARDKPALQVLLLDRLPGIKLSENWVYDLVKNDTTGILVKFLLTQGVSSSETDEHGWALMDFAYATDKVLCRNKTDVEIGRVAHQPYKFPDIWVTIATEEQRAMVAAVRSGTSRARSHSRLPVVFAGKSGNYAPYRADHPIPPNKAYYFEVKIVQEGLDRRLTGVGLCTKDTDMTELDPSEPRPAWRNLGYMYFGSGRVEKSGKTIGRAEPFGKGDIIGCHVDLARGIMYFRKNGHKIGLTSRANELLEVSGRLFPCFVTSSIHCQISANFGPPEHGFVYDREEEREFEDSD
ncbi:ankyrin repeat-containing domain protein [Immersiella caudata]|uniref:Ankyrin repeat-containing domain protein n=1 Tax=Immersiella caudata TaxID=314043 RepID=A0AA39WRW1_9PEZI|nr:ankyrin repeat-containing domain protein [Immersiella caudata]